MCRPSAERQGLSKKKRKGGQASFFLFFFWLRAFIHVTQLKQLIALASGSMIPARPLAEMGFSPKRSILPWMRRTVARNAITSKTKPGRDIATTEHAVIPPSLSCSNAAPLPEGNELDSLKSVECDYYYSLFGGRLGLSLSLVMKTWMDTAVKDKIELLPMM